MITSSTSSSATSPRSTVGKLAAAVDAYGTDKMHMSLYMCDKNGEKQYFFSESESVTRVPLETPFRIAIGGRHPA